jgi:putative DNA primase/helicase
VWSRCAPAPADHHPYILAKAAAGAPLDGLRVVPADDPLSIAGQSMAGALLVPAYGLQGLQGLQSLQLIPPPSTGRKMNLPGAPMAGASFSVGDVVSGGVV